MSNSNLYACDILELGGDFFRLIPKDSLPYFTDFADHVDPSKLAEIKVCGMSNVAPTSFEPLGPFVDPSLELSGIDRLEYLRGLETWECQCELDQVLHNNGARYYLCAAGVDISGMSLYVVERKTGVLHNFMAPLRTLTMSFLIDGRTVSYMQLRQTSEFGEMVIKQGLIILSPDGLMEAITLEPSPLSSLWTRLIITKTQRVPIRLSS